MWERNRSVVVGLCGLGELVGCEGGTVFEVEKLGGRKPHLK